MPSTTRPVALCHCIFPLVRIGSSDSALLIDLPLAGAVACFDDRKGFAAADETHHQVDAIRVTESQLEKGSTSGIGWRATNHNEQA